MNLEEFKTSCIHEKVDIVVQKHLIEGNSFFFETIRVSRNEEFKFKKDLSSSIGVHVRDIILIGSGKLGFSIKPEQGVPGLYQFKTFDLDNTRDPNNEKSDLDVELL